MEQKKIHQKRLMRYVSSSIIENGQTTGYQWKEVPSALKYRAMKVYLEIEVKINIFLTSALVSRLLLSHLLEFWHAF
jgi:hypothetical protein